MLRFIYSLPYDQITDSASKDENATTISTDLMFHANVFRVGDKYEVPDLCRLVATKFKHLIASSISTVSFATCVKLICFGELSGMADTSLKDAVAEFCSKNLNACLKEDRFQRMIVAQEPTFGKWLLENCNVAESIELSQCSNCHIYVRGKIGHLCGKLGRTVDASAVTPVGKWHKKKA